MKSNKFKWIGASAILAIGIITGSIIGNTMSVGTSAVTPGTVSDPVVTKSYVDEQIAKITGGNVGGSTGSSSNNGSTVLEVVTVPAGSTLMVNAGSEVVVRAGKAIAYSSDANGISDVTEGVDIKNGKAVPTNHLIWFPREGRGIQVDPSSNNSLTVMVKGPYYIQ